MPKGFMDTSTYYVQRPVVKKKQAHDCSSCGLYLNCKAPKTSYTGLGGKRILIVDGAISQYEDAHQNKKHGSTYEYLKNKLARVGIDLEQDCWYTHAIKCYTRKPKNWSVKTLSACNSMLHKEIDSLKPSIIVTVDSLAWTVLLYDRSRGRASNARYTDWCGYAIPDQTLKTWVVPMYETSLMQSVDKEQAKRQYPYNMYELTYHKQLDLVKTYLSEDFPIYDFESKVTIAHNEAEAINILAEVCTWDKWYAFDFETNGIKSQRNDKKIYSISFSNGVKHVAMRWYDSPRFLEAASLALTNSAKKIAHNKAYENIWAQVRAGVQVTNLNHDSMLAQHVMHCDDPTNLKFCSYAYLGILGYDEEADEWLKSSRSDKESQGANASNNIFQAPEGMILKYNAMDSATNFYLCQLLEQNLDPIHQLPGYKFLCASEKALSKAHIQGIEIDMDILRSEKPKLQERMDVAYSRIMKSDFIQKHWPYGEFNPRSTDHLKKMLYTILKEPITEYTDSGQPATDVDVLLKHRHKYPFLDDIIDYKRADKLLNTYLAQFEREQVYGKIHTFFNTHTVVTFRGSADSPSFQNISKRDKEAKRVTRQMLHSRKGTKIGEYDIKGAEVSAGAAISGDSNLIRYVTNPDLDMHRDLAAQCFWMDALEVPKKVRGNVVKGPFTFAEFYGSTWRNVAAGMMDEMDIPDPVGTYGIDLIERCRQHGIHTFHESAKNDQPSDWETHIKALESYLWDDMFPDYKKCRRDLYSFYKKHGYVDYVNGFRYDAVKSFTQVANAPFQGPAYHIQQWCFNYITEALEDRKFDSYLFGSVHDAILAGIYPDEEVDFDKLVCEAFTEVRNYWSWITVPIFVEKSINQVDQSWYDLEEVGVINY